MVVPILVSQVSPFVGYLTTVCCFAVAILIFIVGSGRYVKMAPQGKNNMTVISIVCKAVCMCRGFVKQKQSHGGAYPDAIVGSISQLLSVIPVTMLVLPFNIIYSQQVAAGCALAAAQTNLVFVPLSRALSLSLTHSRRMVNIFVVQGSVMAPAGFIDASWMQNFDAFSVLVVGLVVSMWLYPELEKRNMSLHLAHKFLIGSICSAIAALCSVVVDYEIHSVYNSTGQSISVLWQMPAFFFIGAGEIFAISAAYEAAFLIAPKNLKALSSATNIFLIGGVPQYISTAILAGCTTIAFTNAQGSQTLDTLPEYATAHVYIYFWILFGIALFGVAINALPATKRFLTRTLQVAEEANADKVAIAYDVPVAEEAQKLASNGRIAQRPADDLTESPPDSTPSVIGDISIEATSLGKLDAASMALV